MAVALAPPVLPAAGERLASTGQALMVRMGQQRRPVLVAQVMRVLVAPAVLTPEALQAETVRNTQPHLSMGVGAAVAAGISTSLAEPAAHTALVPAAVATWAVLAQAAYASSPTQHPNKPEGDLQGET